MKNLTVQSGWILPGMPHILLAADKNPGWMRLRKAFSEVQKKLEQSHADLLIIYSTYWPSILGHQIQALPEPEFVLVDEEFHELGSIPYKLKIDADFAKIYQQTCQDRGLFARTVAYSGFPIDTGSVVVLSLLNPQNRIPAVIVSSNIYADRAETVVLGKAARDAIEKNNRSAVAIAVTSLSNRLHAQWIPPEKDHISSLKDEEWNRKYLEFLDAGRLEEASQLSRQFHREARVPKVNNFKPLWWLSALMGSHNNYEGQVFAYEPVYGTGAAVIGLTPQPETSAQQSIPKGNLEFDEEDPQIYRGDRNVIATSDSAFSSPSFLPQDSYDLPTR